MLINTIKYVKPISFGHIKNEYKNSDVKAREKIRNDIEPRDFPDYDYCRREFLMTKARIDVMNKYKPHKASNLEETNNRRKTIQNIDVDVDLLERQKIYSFRERVKNKIYTGQELSTKPEAVKALKEAGINSILCLVPLREQYKEYALKNGLNYVDLRNIGNKTLNVFNFDAIKDIMEKPELYAQSGIKEIDDLKTFVDIVNGMDKDFPGPIYMGCDWGTNRTYEWYTIFQILRDQSKDKPLTPERISELSEIIKSFEDARR